MEPIELKSAAHRLYEVGTVHRKRAFRLVGTPAAELFVENDFAAGRAAGILPANVAFMVWLNLY